jgi:subtilisin family serine protease
MGWFFSKARRTCFVWRRVFALRGLESLRNTSTLFLPRHKIQPRRARVARPGVFFELGRVLVASERNALGAHFSLLVCKEVRVRAKKLGRNQTSKLKTMKAIQPIIGKLIVGCVLALGLTSNVYAQLDPPPGGGTNDPPTPEELAAQWAALVAAQQADYTNNYAPWIIPDMVFGGSPLTPDAFQAQTTSDLLTLSTNIAAMQAEQHAAVSNLLIGQEIAIPQTWTDTNGNVYFFDHIMEGGSAGIKVTHNIESAQTVGAQKLWPGGSSGFNLNGSNVLMAQWDGGDVRTNHQEFTNGFRASLLNGPTARGIQDHPTHVAGTMTAYGVNGTAIGFANRARLLESAFDYDLTEMPQVVATNNVRESNHSYGYAAGWAGLINVSGTLYYLWFGDPAISSSQSWIFGFYDGVAARTNDLIIYTAQTYLPVFSSGNWNGYAAPPSQPVLHVENINGTYYYSTGVRQANDANGGFNTLTSYAVSKNDLVVGAVNVNTNGYIGTNTTTIASLSSRGPTADGRIKPDVVAAGVNILSSAAGSASAYTNMSGTSMAAPAVTGTLGLLTSLYNNLYTSNAPLLSGTNAPLASTLKGIVIHTADQLGTNVGPSYTYGWGLLDAVAAANLITNNHASGSLAFIKEVRLMSGDYIEFPVVLTNNKPFKATIVWTDPPGTPTAPALNPTNRMLVNDLDLRVVAPSGPTNFPYVLNRTAPANAATTGDNNVDNVEQVSIPNPTNGAYRVRVTHKGNLLNQSGQTNFQNVSITLFGNIAQPPILPQITSISALTTSNLVALKWASEVGRIYRLQSRDVLASGSWVDATGELSATKTNTAVVLYVGGVTNQFYRVAQVR